MDTNRGGQGEKRDAAPAKKKKKKETAGTRTRRAKTNSGEAQQRDGNIRGERCMELQQK